MQSFQVETHQQINQEKSSKGCYKNDLHRAPHSSLHALPKNQSSLNQSLMGTTFSIISGYNGLLKSPSFTYC